MIEQSAFLHRTANAYHLCPRHKTVKGVWASLEGIGREEQTVERVPRTCGASVLGEAVLAALARSRSERMPDLRADEWRRGDEAMFRRLGVSNRARMVKDVDYVDFLRRDEEVVVTVVDRNQAVHKVRLDNPSASELGQAILEILRLHGITTPSTR